LALRHEKEEPMAHAQTILIMGPPGAGKGTQAAHLVSEYSLRHVATGDVLRDAVKTGTELGAKAKEYMDRGDLVPDDLIIGLLRELIASLGPEEGVLIDGFPRTVAQAEALDVALAELDRTIGAVLDVAVPKDALIERLAGRWICRDCQTPYNVNTRPPASEGVCDKCGGELYQRADDTSEAVGNRLDVYERQTAPVSEHYTERGLLRVIDGNQETDAVRADIDRELSDAARLS
jgi:adenylate kinase